jgi:hypothetical protein
MVEYLYDRGKAVVEEAIRVDKEGDYPKALRRYKDATELFIDAMR